MPADGYSYPSRVRFEIAQGDLGSYRRAADFLNVNHVDVLSVQHEYGIFGGKAGAHVIALLRELPMPIVNDASHRALGAESGQRAVIDELARLSARLVVMSASGADLLTRVHGISADQIDLIPHGIPHVPVDAASKDRLGVDGRTVILTFGLLSRDKGIEHVIDALPAILAVHPDVVYIVLGATPRLRQITKYRGTATVERLRVAPATLSIRGLRVQVAGQHELGALQEGNSRSSWKPVDRVRRSWPTCRYFTAGNTVFQSFFMLTTVQPFATASSQPLSNCWSLSVRS
jgi:glycosyltransferase involved in cell wall biosynthesis